MLIEGNHRCTVAPEFGITSIPCLVKYGLSEDEMYKLAIQSNEASGAVVPMTMVSYAELVWERSKEGKNLFDIGIMLGWSEAKTKQYSALSAICGEAWSVIVTTFEGDQSSVSEDEVTKEVTTVTFTERLLREILDLTAEQQLELVQELATNKKFTKGMFKTRAENYQTRNEAKAYALEKLGSLGEPYTTKLDQEIDKGAYDDDWRKNPEHPKLHKLIKSLHDEWEEKNNIQIIQGDFYDVELRKTIADNSIDLIITDPPFNIANDRLFEPEGRSAISQDFGEWDKYEREEFLALFPNWAQEWYRVLKDKGSGYVFVADRYLSHLRDALEKAGFQIKSTLSWHKTNPGTMTIKTNFKSSVEFILFFTKGSGGHTFNWLSDEGDVMHNFYESPICAGNERLVDEKNQTLHPTQKPEILIRHLMSISSNPGDMVFDSFAGVFTTGRVAKDMGRHFIGIEKEKKFHEAGKHRVED